MPRESVLAVRLALAWLAFAALLGAALLARGVFDHPEWSAWIVVHAEVMLVGWTMQLAFGVAHWILPRTRTGTRGWVVTTIFVTLNLGLVLVIAGVDVLGRALEAGAAIVFALQALPRVKASGWGATGSGGDLVRLGRKAELT